MATNALRPPVQAGRSFAFKPNTVLRPRTVEQIQTILAPRSRMPHPLRPVGRNSSTTGCTSADGGTVIDMTGFDQIVEIGTDTVTVQAGVSLKQLADALDERGLELAGCYDFCDRTVGGAICGGCIGPSSPADGGLLASQVVGMRVVTAEGRVMRLSQDEPTHHNLLSMFRLSYGMLGVVYEVTLRVRAVQPFAVHYHKMTFDDLAELLPDLSEAPLGLKVYLMPFRNRAYLELRRYEEQGGAPGRRFPWKLKDWLESSAVPAVAQSVARTVPFRRVRYSLIDGFNDVVHALMNNPLAQAGSNSAEQTGRFRILRDQERFTYSSWCFPAAGFGAVLNAYRVFCQDHYREFKFRCDMPTVGFRIARDNGAVLSPSFDQPMFVMSVLSTPCEQWKDFVIDLSDFAAQYEGVPLLNQTKAATPQQVDAAFGSRIAFFRKLRSRIDTGDVLLNPFLAQYMQ